MAVEVRLSLGAPVHFIGRRTEEEELVLVHPRAFRPISAFRSSPLRSAFTPVSGSFSPPQYGVGLHERISIIPEKSVEGSWASVAEEVGSAVGSVIRPLERLSPRIELAEQQRAKNLLLIYALDHFKVEEALAAIEAGADPKTCSTFGFSIGHVVVCGGTEEQLERALELGADMMVQDRNRRTPFHVAAINGNTAFCKRLISLGADPRGVDIQGNSPYLLALIHKKIDTVEWLALHTDVDYVSLNRGGHNAFHYLMEEDVPIALLQLALGEEEIDLGKVNTWGETPLALSIKFREEEKACLLVQAGASVDDDFSPVNTYEIVARKQALPRLTDTIRKHSSKKQNARTDQLIATKLLAARLNLECDYDMPDGERIYLGSIHPVFASQAIIRSLSAFFTEDPLLSPSREGWALVQRAFERFPRSFSMTPEEIKELLDAGEMVILPGGSRAHLVPYLLYDHHTVAINTGSGAKPISSTPPVIQPFQVRIGPISVEMIERIQHQAAEVDKSERRLLRETAALTEGERVSCLEDLRATPQETHNCGYEGLKFALIPALMFAKTVGKSKTARSKSLPFVLRTFQGWVSFERKQAVLDYLRDCPKIDVGLFSRAVEHSLTLKRPTERTWIKRSPSKGKPSTKSA